MKIRNIGDTTIRIIKNPQKELNRFVLSLDKPKQLKPIEIVNTNKAHKITIKSGAEMFGYKYTGNDIVLLPSQRVVIHYKESDKTINLSFI